MRSTSESITLENTELFFISNFHQQVVIYYRIMQNLTEDNFMRNINNLFIELQNSEFRSSFRLGKKEGKYLARKGLEEVIKEGEGFIRERLCPENPENDGRQTPMKNHPFFIAQHATGCCCRGCLSKWHKIARGKRLSDRQIRYILEVTQKWLESQPECPKSGESAVRQKRLFQF